MTLCDGMVWHEERASASTWLNRQRNYRNANVFLLYLKHRRNVGWRGPLVGWIPSFSSSVSPPSAVVAPPMSAHSPSYSSFLLLNLIIRSVKRCKLIHIRLLVQQSTKRNIELK